MRVSEPEVYGVWILLEGYACEGDCWGDGCVEGCVFGSEVVVLGLQVGCWCLF